jgi:hypothetical protein
MDVSYDLVCSDDGIETVTVDSSGDGVYVLSQWEREGREVPLLHRVVVNDLMIAELLKRPGVLRVPLAA